MCCATAIGIDWTHPAFGGFQKVPNQKVVFAVSYTGEPQKDNFGHGSHCAGIAAGDLYMGTARGDSQIQGVAPRAQLMSYKVLSAMGSGTAAAIILAIEDAVQRGAHVINLSLGEAMGDPNSPEAVAVNNAILAGTIVCCAAGNSGPGEGTVGSPGSADLVITVGASTDDSVTATYARAVGVRQKREVETRLLHGSAPLHDPAWSLGYVQCGLGRDAGDFPDQAFGRIALIQRGGVPFRQKAKAAEAAGALAAVIVNNTTGNFWGTLGDATPNDPQPAIPVLSIAQEDGEYLLRLGFDQSGISRAPLQLDPARVPIPDRLAEFSSRGPNQDGAIKPELCAPGVNIFSATILAGPFPGVPNMADPSGYTVASGTSMATPHMAGAAALLRQLHPEWSPAFVKAALVNTAVWMQGQGGATEQGNGRLDLRAAAGVPALLVADAQPVQPTLSFGTVDHQGELTSLVQGLRLIDLAGSGGGYTLHAHMATRVRGLSVAVSRKQVTLPQGCGASLQLTLTLDGQSLADGAYYGFVTATGQGTTLRLPFFLSTTGAAPTGTGINAHVSSVVTA